MTTERAEGLLDQIAASALDDDYYLVRAPEERPRWGDRLLTGVAVAAFSLMVTVAAVQTQVDRPASEREQQALADDVAARRSVQADQRTRLEALRAEVTELTASADRSDPRLEALAARAGDVAVRGPGLTVTVTPSASDGGIGDVSDDDLQQLVNALWFVGAEAIAVNGERVGTRTSIRTAGQAITVNYESISPPYVVEAIGDGERMRDRLAASRLGASWDDRARAADLGFRIDTDSDLRLDAIASGRQRLDHATPEEDGS